MKLFEYAIIYKPTSKEAEKGVEAKLVVAPKTLLADTQQNALLLAAREIPKEYLNKLNQVEVAIRPF